MRLPRRATDCPRPAPPSRGSSLAGHDVSAPASGHSRLAELLKLAAFSLAKAREITEAPGYTGPLANTIKYAEGLTRFALNKVRDGTTAGVG
jgi:hypothetical protein